MSRVVLPGGARGVLSNGNRAVLDSNGDCSECCEETCPPEWILYTLAGTSIASGVCYETGHFNFISHRVSADGPEANSADGTYGPDRTICRQAPSSSVAATGLITYLHDDYVRGESFERSSCEDPVNKNQFNWRLRIRVEFFGGTQNIEYAAVSPANAMGTGMAGYIFLYDAAINGGTYTLGDPIPNYIQAIGGQSRPVPISKYQTSPNYMAMYTGGTLTITESDPP